MYTQHIYNYHLDGYNHVNNARYLEFLEAARWHYFEQHQLKQSLRKAQLVVVHMDIRYRQAARLDDILHIHSSLINVQSRQLIVKQEIIFAHINKVCAQAKITLIPTDTHGKVSRLPENLYRQCIQLSENNPS